MTHIRCWFLTSKCCKGCMFLWTWKRLLQMHSYSNAFQELKTLKVWEAQPTIRPAVEKTLTDSAPKYFKRSSFSSWLSSAGKCRIRSVLQPFVWTTSSFLSISLQDNKIPQTKHKKKDFRLPTTSHEYYVGFCWLSGTVSKSDQWFFFQST